MANPFDAIAPGSDEGTSSSQKSYDVFINHHGEDTKLSVASIIYHLLHRHGVRAFLDKKELQLGCAITKEIKDAISSASVHIAIFSPKYAESPWCLQELSLMAQTNVTIIPVFYGVDPSDLRYKKGKYARALRGLQEKPSECQTQPRYRPEKIEEWKKALRRFSFRYGAILLNDKCDQGVLYMEILDCVLRNIKKVPLKVATFPVGLEDAVKRFKSTIGSSKGKVRIVGIVGIGGSGKTTLAKEFYNRERSSLSRSRECSSISKFSFLSDVSNAASKDTLHQLQIKLLKDLDISHDDIQNTDEGSGILATRSIYENVLIVLDNVDNFIQIHHLLPIDMFRKLGQDSLIVVTTREKNILQQYCNRSTIYQMELLDEFKARELFCKYAFSADMQDSSSQIEFQDLIQRFVKACKGLPLSLRVLGAMVNGYNKEYWGLQLKKELPKDIADCLRLSYDALDPTVQQMFLDVACFFIGRKKSLVVDIWDGSGWSEWTGELGWETLVNKCLVGLDQGDCIEMHDHLRDLGRQIARDASPSRIWKEEQIRNHDGTTPIRGIVLDRFKNCWSTLEDCMEKIKPSLRELQLLTMRQIDFRKEFSANLVWLRLFELNGTNLPSWLSLKALRRLELYDANHLKELWQDHLEPPLQLREIVIRGTEYTRRGTFRGLPRSVEHLRHLKKVILQGSQHSEMTSLPEEFCSLEALEILELDDFPMLSSLPEEFGKLSNLRSLLLERLQLMALPHSFKQLRKLQSLHILECRSLVFTSDTLNVLEFMTQLQVLRFECCHKLEELPHLKSLVSLRNLSLSKTGLWNLPNISQLTRLETLQINGNSKLMISPGSFSELSCLTYIHIEHCIMSESLSEAFGRLSNLQDLNIWSNKVIVAGSGMASPSTYELGILTDLILGMGMESASTCNLTSLKCLNIEETTVRSISISDGCCPSLETLTLNRNHYLTEIETLPGNVREINVQKCSRLKSMRGIAGLPKLQSLTVWECPNLEELPCPLKMHSIERKISISRCPKIHKRD